MDITITLPPELKGFIDAQVEAGGFSNSSEYISALVLAHRKRVAQRLDALLLEGLNSGPSIPADEAYWADLERRLESES